MKRSLTTRLLASAMVVVTAYTPLFASLNGTIAHAQAVQNTTYSYLYDAMGNLTQLTDPLGRVSNQSHDPLNRVKQQLQPPPATGAARPAVNYTYDGRDQLVTVSDPRALVTSYSTTGLGDEVGLVSPDTGTTSRTHDAAGNLASVTDARGKLTSYQYDPLNRLRRIDYATGAPSVFEYDGGAGGAANAIGRLTKMTDESGQTVYHYDQMGRMLSKTQTVNATAVARARTVQYAYDASGRVSNLTYPSGNRIAYEYGPAGRISTILLHPAAAETTTPTVLLKQIAYAPFGAVQSWMWGNSSDTAPNSYTRTFDLDGRVTSYPLGNIGAESGVVSKVLGRVTRTLTYDAASRITAMTHSGVGLGANLDQAYGYDDLGRLTSYTGSNASQAYKYDANGNRTQLSVGATAYANTIAAGGNRLTGTSGPVPAKSNTYDAAGNLATDGVVAYSHNDRGRLARAVNAGIATDYLYNAIGQRVSKAGAGVAGGANHYVYDERGQLLGEYAAGGAALQETVYLDDLPVAVLRGGGVWYVYADHINTPRVIARSGDNLVVWRWDQADPFGLQQPNENPAGYANFTYNPRFPGQLFDRETNNHYNYHRDYDPQTGRYVQSDPIGLAGGVNTYGYVGANPLSFTDPKGLNPATAAGAGIGTVIFPGPGTVVGAIIGTGIGIWAGDKIYDAMTAPKAASNFPPGVWPGDKGADEWGRRNKYGAKEGRGRFHGVKQDCPGSKPTDVYGVNPETGDVYDPAGDIVGNLEDAKRK